jgi:glutathione-regulated potassium-efflux system ancillary protein KefG
MNARARAAAVSDPVPAMRRGLRPGLRGGPLSTLVVVSHPDIAHSRAHRRLLAAIAGLPDVAIRHLEALYPDSRIDAAAEQDAALQAARIVFQFPLYWFSTPPMLKAWQDAVYAVGFAYGPGGTRLRGKLLQPVLTAGGAQEKYRPGGHNRYEIADLLRPLETAAHFVGMTMRPPLVLFHVPNVEGIPVPADVDARIEAFARRYRDLLAAPATVASGAHA